MENKTCCLTGHRPKGFPWDYYNKNSKAQQLYLDTLRAAVVDLIENHGYNYFISGMALGADMDFAELCLNLKEQYPDRNIMVEGAVPFPGQADKFSKTDLDRYNRIIDRLDKVEVVCEKYVSFCFQKRNEYMVNHSDGVIAVWNGEEKGGTYNTIKYAKKAKKPIRYVYLQNIDQLAYE